MNGSGPAAALPAARSYLFVPGNRPERFGKALSSGADRVVLDLEDAVAPNDKAAARDAVAAFVHASAPHGRAQLVVRINSASTPWFDADVAMLASAGALAVMLPKAEACDTIANLRGVCPGIAVLPLVETAVGVDQAHALASAPGVERLVLGAIDLALDLDLSGDAIGLDPFASRLALVSRVAGIASPVAGVTPEIDDDTRLQTDVARARAFGLSAKLCIHPRQVAVLHAALRPTAAEVDWARRVLQATDGNPAAAQVDGRMVDKPVLLRAQAILARAATDS